MCGSNQKQNTMSHWTVNGGVCLVWNVTCNRSCVACIVPQECTMKVQEGKFKLQDLLVVPMQRVLKYHLLLKARAFSTQPTPPPTHTHTHLPIYSSVAARAGTGGAGLLSPVARRSCARSPSEAAGTRSGSEDSLTNNTRFLHAEDKVVCCVCFFSSHNNCFILM